LNWFVVRFESLSNIYVLYSRRPVCGLSTVPAGTTLSYFVKVLVIRP
jgi:hypothetical protein